MGKKDNTVLTLYTLKNCIYCNWLKGKLNEDNIKYNEIIIDDGKIYNDMLGDSLEKEYQTESYPIIEITNKFNNKISFISKTNLAPTKNIIIFESIEELINKIKKNYEV